MQHTSVLVSLALLASSVPALADVAGPGGKVIECFCTDTSGARVELGQTICLFVDGTMFTAQCQMSLNVPMWRKLDDGCLSAQADQSPVPDVLPRL